MWERKSVICIVKTGLWDSGKYARHLRKIFRKNKADWSHNKCAGCQCFTFRWSVFWRTAQSQNCHTAAFLPEQKITPSRGETERRRRKRNKKQIRKRERRKVICRDSERARQVSEYSCHDDVSPNESSWTFRPEDDASLELCVPDRCVPTLCRWPLKSRHNQSHHEVRPYHSPSKGLLVRGHIVQGAHRQGAESPRAFFLWGTSVRDELMLDHTRCNWRWTWILRDRNMLWRIGWIEKRMFPFTGKNSAEVKASRLKKSSNHHRLPLWLYPADRDRGRRRGIKL